MATDPRVLLDAAFAAYGDNPPPGYRSTGRTIINNAGLYVGTPEKAKTLVLQRHWAIGRR